MTQSDSVTIAAKPVGMIQRISIRYGGSKPRELERFLKFVIVGLIGTVIDLGLTNILLFAFRIQRDNLAGVQIAGGIGFVTAVTSNFIINRYWTYPDSRSRPILKQAVQFFAVNAVGLVIREIVLAIFSVPFGALIGRVTGTTFSSDLQGKLGDNMALILSIAIVLFWNFFVNRHWTYNDVE